MQPSLAFLPGFDVSIKPGAGQNSSTNTRLIDRVMAPHTGAVLCVSGAYSGERCAVTVGGTATRNLKDRFGNRYQARLWYGNGLNGAEVVGAGDSGAPLYSLSGNSVWAVGIASQGEIRADCVGVKGDRKCYSRVYFGDVSAQARDWQLALNR